MDINNYVTKSLVEESFTYKEILIKLGCEVTHWNREKLKKIIKQNNYEMGKTPTRVGKSGLLSDITLSDLKILISRHNNWSSLMRDIGYTNVRGAAMKTLQQFVKKYNFDTSHFIGKAAKGRKSYKSKDNAELFVKNSTSVSAIVRNRILKEDLIPYKCAKCFNDGNWNGEPLTLQLEHINGINTDHRLKNLEFLCPNCHTQTKTWGRKTR